MEYNIQEASFLLQISMNCLISETSVGMMNGVRCREGSGISKNVLKSVFSQHALFFVFVFNLLRPTLYRRLLWDRRFGVSAA